MTAGTRLPHRRNPPSFTDLKTGQWVKLAPLPLGKHALGAATIGNVVYFPGGSSTRGGEGVTAEMMTFTLPQ